MSENNLTILIILLLFVLIIITKKVKKFKSILEFRSDFRNSVPKLVNEFGMTKKEGQMLERIYRIETAHFKSGQGRGTFSPGMEKFSNTYPYGWNSLNNYFWKNYPEYSPVGFESYTEGGTGKKKYFLKFPNVFSAMATVLMNARMNRGNFAAWYSKNPDFQRSYLNSLMKINPKIINEVFS